LDTKWRNSALPYAGLTASYYLLALAVLCAVDLAVHQDIWYSLVETPWTSYRDNLYYTSIRERLRIEIIIGAVSLILGGFLYWKQRGLERPAGLKFTKLLRKPADVRAVVCAGIVFLLLFLCTNLSFFYVPFSFNQVIALSVIAYITAALLRLTESLFPLLYSAEKRHEERGNSLFFRSIRIWGKGLSDFKLLFAVGVVLGATALAGFMAAVFLTSYSMRDFAFAVILAYLVIAGPLGLYILGTYNKLRTGAREISQGNLNRELEERDSWPFTKIAVSINSMKDGYLKALEEQVKSERLKTELITNVSHDLKTPLTSIVNYVDLLHTEGLDSDTRQKYLNVLTQKTDRLKVLIDDLFEASKMASGAVELQMERIDVAALLDQALAEFSDKIAASSLTFRVKGAENHVFARLDGRKMWRVFENLIGNALKYSQPGTRVYMHLEETIGYISFTMKNISAYEIDFEVDELMERFKRGDASRSTEGSGLGLAIARSIVELQGGSFRIELDGDVFKVLVLLPK
jgi:signal transduction histidine kinase